MSRITDRFVVQRVDALLVFMDDSTGTEITVPVAATPQIVAALSYLATEDVALAAAVGSTVGDVMALRP